jgi:CRISPR-associated protein Cas1
VNGAVRGNVLLRREQYRRADDAEASATIARTVISAKIANCRTVLLRSAREHSDAAAAKALSDASGRLARVLADLDSARTVDSLRGKEGDAARVYFGVFDHLIIAQKETFAFHERSRRPPLDPINALLSFLYMLVLHDIESALETVGLDPGVGFLHRDRPGRPGLALDILEEFRPYLADRLALTLVNRQQVKDKGFDVTESGAVLMDDDTRKEVLTAFQKRKQEEIQHPYLGEKVSIGLLPYVHALLMSRYLRGDIDGYPPFIAQ